MWSQSFAVNYLGCKGFFFLPEPDPWVSGKKPKADMPLNLCAVLPADGLLCACAMILSFAPYSKGFGGQSNNREIENCHLKPNRAPAVRQGP